MLKMEILIVEMIIVGMFLFQTIFLFIIQKRVSAVIRLLNIYMNREEPKKRISESHSELKKINDIENGDNIVKITDEKEISEIREKEDLINEVLSEIFC